MKLSINELYALSAGLTALYDKNVKEFKKVNKNFYTTKESNYLDDLIDKLSDEIKEREEETK